MNLCIILIPGILFFVCNLSVGVIIEKHSDDYCFATDPIKEQVRRFFSKTAYQFIRANESITTDCQPQRLWLLSRHGTRLTPAKDTKKLRENLPAIRDEILANNQTKLCAEDLRLLKAWTWDANVTEDQSEYLSPQGWEDLRGLAKYLQEQFPLLLPKKYAKDNFFFRHTNIQRTQASFRAFAEGLFGSYADVEVAPIPEMDTLLRPYDFSDEWKKQKEEIYEDGSEYTKFRKTSHFLNMLESVSKRGGYAETQSSEKIEMIFKACTYEQAWKIHEPSAWCSLFTPDDVKILEYMHDLEEYYLAGGSSELNKLLPAELVDNLVKHFESGNEKPKVIAFFAHSTILELFLAALGVAQNGIPLRADNYDKMEDRKWRTSEIVPFTGNVAVVGFVCESNPWIRIMSILNEKVVAEKN